MNNPCAKCGDYCVAGSDLCHSHGGIKEYLSSIGRKGGSAKSAKKAKSSRRNGKKGGRPKVKVSETNSKGEI